MDTVPSSGDEPWGVDGLGGDRRARGAARGIQIHSDHATVGPATGDEERRVRRHGDVAHRAARLDGRAERGQPRVGHAPIGLHRSVGLERRVQQVTRGVRRDPRRRTGSGDSGAHHAERTACARSVGFAGLQDADPLAEPASPAYAPTQRRISR
ncbi:hypothetical protein HR12_02905 [Microbacterium sp. SUBG005]|nr:hypothetical protein HR12_02905 [Microbacterium sp. SUBG005]